MVFSIAACTKDEQFYKVEFFHINLTGYNGSSSELEMKAGPSAFPAPIWPNTSFEMSNACTFGSRENQIMLLITEKASGKLVLEKELKKEDKQAKMKFLHMDGKIGPMTDKPAVEIDKISLVYMFQPTVTNFIQSLLILW